KSALSAAVCSHDSSGSTTVSVRTTAHEPWSWPGSKYRGRSLLFPMAGLDHGDSGFNQRAKDKYVREISRFAVTAYSWWISCAENCDRYFNHSKFCNTRAWDANLF